MSTTSRTILITGATSGLGRELAVRLARSGATVLVHGRDPNRTAALVAQLRANGGAATAYVADLASRREVTDLAGKVAADHPRLDVLINNAGIGSGRPGSGRELSPDGDELRLSVNYLAPVLLTRLLLPSLSAAAPSRVVNVGSVGQSPIDVGDLAFASGYHGAEAYRRSKFALAAWTFDLAGELRERGIAVNVLHPASFMDTAMVREAGVNPINSVDDGVRAVLALVDDLAPDVTGQYFDGPHRTRAHPGTYDPALRARLRAATDALLGCSGE